MSDSSFFSDLTNTKPFFKAALEGFAGSGKTMTAALIAIGLHQRIGSKQPVTIFDTEEAAKFLRPLFTKQGITVQVKRSRSLADLKETMKILRGGEGHILIIDSISHIWESFLEAYRLKTKRAKLEFQDWGVLKPTWRTEFSDPFVRDPYHVIMCGRAGYEYGSEKNEETGKREIFKSGIKMKVEGDTAYEPDVLVLMERFEEVLEKDKAKRVWREATVLKDRSTLIDGKTFRNPTYADFAPVIDALLQDAAYQPLGAEGNAQLLFKTEEEKTTFRRDRDKALEEIEGLLGRAFPGSTGKDKQSKLEAFEHAFQMTSATAIAELPIEALREGWGKIAQWLIDKGIAEWRESGERRRLEMVRAA